MQIEKIELSSSTLRILAIAFAAGFVLGLVSARGIQITMFNVLIGSNHNRINS